MGALSQKNASFNSSFSANNSSYVGSGSSTTTKVSNNPNFQGARDISSRIPDIKNPATINKISTKAVVSLSKTEFVLMLGALAYELTSEQISSWYNSLFSDSTDTTSEDTSDGQASQGGGTSTNTSMGGSIGGGTFYNGGTDENGGTDGTGDPTPTPSPTPTPTPDPRSKFDFDFPEIPKGVSVVEGINNGVEVSKMGVELLSYVGSVLDNGFASLADPMNKIATNLKALTDLYKLNSVKDISKDIKSSSNSNGNTNTNSLFPPTAGSGVVDNSALDDEQAFRDGLIDTLKSLKVSLEPVEIVRTEDELNLTSKKLDHVNFETTPIQLDNLGDIIPELTPQHMKAIQNAVTAKKHSDENTFEYDNDDLNDMFGMPDISAIFNFQKKSDRWEELSPTT